MADIVGAKFVREISENSENSESSDQTRQRVERRHYDDVSEKYWTTISYELISHDYSHTPLNNSLYQSFIGIILLSLFNII